MDNLINALINYGILGIIIAGFCEAIFLPLPMELVFIPISLLNPNKAFIYSIILIVFSFFGSIIGYHIGKLFQKTLLNKFISTNNLITLKRLYNKNPFLTILTSAFTPIPFEAYVLSAGILNINFKKFILASIISRLIRYIPEGIIISLYGEILLSSLKAYVVIIGLSIFLIIYLFKYFSNHKTKNIS